jgi:glucuronokinase
MDFSKDLMDRQGYGNYQLLDPGLLPKLYVAYRTELSEGTEAFHRGLRERWLAGESAVVEAMHTWASYAEQGRAALLARDHAKLGRLIDANFDLRSSLCHIGEGNMQMIETARAAGATANFAGSGGAIAGTYADQHTYDALVAAMRPLGVAVIRPRILAAAQ